MLDINSKVIITDVSGDNDRAEFISKEGRIIRIDTDVSAWEYGYVVEVNGITDTFYPWEIELATNKN